MLAAGARLGAYEILAPLGEGGMGQVYRARDTRLLREVALKVLPPARARDSVALDRFASEARAASAVNDPHIVAVHDVGHVEDVHFIVMELVEGCTLRDRLASGPLRLAEALAIAGQVAAGLAAAHGRDVVHRDLKPENVLIGREGRVKIADFGLAKLKQPLLAAPDAATVDDAFAGSERRTDPSLLLGTISYMSPEQAAGGLVDHRTDQFSFGVMLQEMLAGRRPFARGTPAGTLAAIIRDDPEPVGIDAGRAGEPLRWILERCLAKDPAQRYDSTRDLVRDLDRLLDEVTSVGARRTARDEGRTVSTRRRTFALTVGLGAAGTGLLGLGVWIRRHGKGEPRFKRLTFERGTAWNGRYGPDGSTIIYAAAWNGQPFRLYRKEPHSPASLPVSVSDSAVVLSISTKGEMAVLVQPRVVLPGRLVGTLARVPVTGGAPRPILENVADADWSPDGESLALVRHVNGQCVLEYPAGHPLHETAGWLSEPRVSRDGASVAVFEHPLAIHDMGVVWLIGATGHRARLEGAWTSSHGMAWSPDGDELWLGASRGDGPNALYAVGLSGATRLLARAPGTLTLLDVSGSGEALVTRETRRLSIAVLTPDGQRHDLSILDSSVLADLSTDGSTVLSTEYGEGGGMRHSVYLRRSLTADPLRLGDGMAVALSRDGSWALAVIPGGPSQLVAYPTGPGEPRPIAAEGLSYTHAASFFPDGRRLAVAGVPPSGGARLFIHDLHRGTARQVSDDPLFLGHMQGFPVSPDGRWIAAISPERVLTLYSTADGTPRRFANAPPSLLPLQWIDEGQGLLVARLGDVPAPVLRLDAASGTATSVREIPAEDPTGVHGFPCIRVSADGRTYAVTLARVLSELFSVTNL